MDIQQFIARKREAGAKKLTGTSEDWAGWDICDLRNAIAGELLDACAYCERIIDIVQKNKIRSSYETRSASEAVDMIADLKEILEQFNKKNLESACAEAEAKVESGRFNCPYCNVERKLWDVLPDNSYLPNGINIIQCGECGEEFDVFIRGQFDFEVMPITGDDE